MNRGSSDDEENEDDDDTDRDLAVHMRENSSSSPLTCEDYEQLQAMLRPSPNQYLSGPGFEPSIRMGLPLNVPAFARKEYLSCIEASRITSPMDSDETLEIKRNILQHLFRGGALKDLYHDENYLLVIINNLDMYLAYEKNIQDHPWE